ncbi:MAG TPA: GTP-binding protein [Gaiellaceae bacterium]|nr:GTP-binding protein [Gaiellaceae bacterium]
MERIPVTVLTGFLGAGKSTLLRRVLMEEHGRKIAVIVNEFGEEDIDSEIIVSDDGDEQIVQLTNGCLCCGIRDDLRATLCDLARRRAAGELEFDQVMIETTGLADPGPVAQTFFLDEEVATRYRPDAVLTLVDAVHGMEQLDTWREARRQVGFADRLFVSKVDLAIPDAVETLTQRLLSMNPRAPQRRASFGDVPLDEVFDVGGFNLDAELDLDEGHVDHDGHHHHDDDVTSVAYRSDRPFEPARFAQFMSALVQGYGTRLLRYKGVVNLAGQERKVIFQGVHQLMSHDAGAAWAPDEPRTSRLVFIGLELPGELLTRGLEQCLT